MVNNISAFMTGRVRGGNANQTILSQDGFEMRGQFPDPFLQKIPANHGVFESDVDHQDLAQLIVAVRQADRSDRSWATSSTSVDRTDVVAVRSKCSSSGQYSAGRPDGSSQLPGLVFPLHFVAQMINLHPDEIRMLLATAPEHQR
jgi:hypothetical protein